CAFACIEPYGRPAHRSSNTRSSERTRAFTAQEILRRVPRQAGTADARIGQAVDEGQALVPQRPFEGVPEVLGPLDPDPEPAEGLSHGSEVRVLQRCGRGPTRVFAVLMAADRAVDRVVVDHDGDV